MEFLSWQVDIYAWQAAEKAAWMYVAFPVLVVTALFLGVRGRSEPSAQLDTPAKRGYGTAYLLTETGILAMVGAATAVALGGPGTMLWAVAFAVVMLFIRGQSHRTAAPRTFLRTLIRHQSRTARMLGWSCLALGGCVALSYVGCLQGNMIQLTAGGLQSQPDDAVILTLALIVAVGATTLPRRWVVGAGAATLGTVVLLVFGVLLSRWHQVPAALGRAVTDALSGAPSAHAFGGADPGQVALSAITHILPPLAVASVLGGAFTRHSGHAEERNTDARRIRQRRPPISAANTPVFYALCAVVVGLSVVSTGAYFRRLPETKPLSQLRAYRAPLSVGGEDRKPERLDLAETWSGYYRVNGGESSMPFVWLATDTSVVAKPRFQFRGVDGDLALRFEDGKLVQLQVEGPDGAMESLVLTDAALVQVTGLSAPGGAALLAHAVSDGLGPWARSVLLWTLIVFGAVATGLWGRALMLSTRHIGPRAIGWGLAALAPVGLPLALIAPWLSHVGSVLAATLVTLMCGALLLTSRSNT